MAATNIAYRLLLAPWLGVTCSDAQIMQYTDWTPAISYAKQAHQFFELPRFYEGYPNKLPRFLSMIYD